MRIKEAIAKVQRSTKSVFSIAADVQNSDGEFTQFIAFGENGNCTISLENKKRNVKRAGLTFADVISFIAENHLAHRSCSLSQF